MKTFEGWMIGCISKRTPDSLRVLTDLVEAGLKRGECSALDVRDVHFDEPNIIGCTTRILKNLGFVHTDRRAVSVAKRKHGRRVDIWELRDRSKAEAFVETARRELLGIVTENNGQMKMAM